MANKQNPPGDDGRSDVEFLYFKGKLRSADIQALVSGFTSTRASNTLPGRAPSKQIPAPPAQNGQNGTSEADREVEFEMVEEAEVLENGAEAPKAATPRKGKRTYPTPATVEMDMAAGGKAFKDFAREKGPKSTRDRYLVAATWCREFAKLELVSAGHVRTCYIAAGWTYKVQDPIQPFRNLRDEGLGAVTDGSFNIGHLGLAEVQEMKGDSTASA